MYPSFDDSILHSRHTFDKNNNIWLHPNFGCELEFSNFTRANLSVKWICEETRYENQRVQFDLQRLRNEFSELFLDYSKTSFIKSKQAATLLAVAGIARATGVGLGFKSKSFVKGFFGGCEEIANKTRPPSKTQSLT